MGHPLVVGLLLMWVLCQKPEEREQAIIETACSQDLSRGVLYDGKVKMFIFAGDDASRILYEEVRRNV